MAKATTQKPANGSALDFEAQLWAAADKMRGHIDASEYIHHLSPVGAAEVEDDDELFEQKMKRLTRTLEEQFAESAKLEEAIRQNLKALSHG
ncbi:MAG: hypothetical protein ABSG59_10840 [Verrucomicrobiota bacterium]